VGSSQLDSIHVGSNHLDIVKLDLVFGIHLLDLVAWISVGLDPIIVIQSNGIQSLEIQ
jgi:hypothetical protein